MTDAETRATTMRAYCWAVEREAQSNIIDNDLTDLKEMGLIALRFLVRNMARIHLKANVPG